MTPEERAAEIVRTLRAHAQDVQIATDYVRLHLEEALNEEREACAVASEVWTEGRSRFITAASAIRARKPLK